MIERRADFSAAYSEQMNDTVFVIDDDPLVLEGLHLTLLRSGFKTIKFESAEEFLAHVGDNHSGCVVTDIRMPGMSGLELQEELARRNVPLPVIIMSGHADVPLAVRAMKAGALDILEKPFGNEQLISHVQGALAVSREKMAQERETRSTRDKLGSLTSRERDVLKLVVAGQANKEIARSLDISPRTVEVHRARLMRKMQAESVAELVKLAGSGMAS